jgi:UDP:flavonoid glycosyltransferase YjiC (YdhE family)
MLPFATALIDAGHEVQVAAPESFADVVERSGLHHWACGDIAAADFALVQAEIARAPDQARTLFATRILADLGARAILPGMLAAIDEWRPDAILRDVAELGSFVAAEMRSVRQVAMLIVQHRLIANTFSLAAPTLAKLRESVGLPGDPDGERLRAVPLLSLLPRSFEEPSFEESALDKASELGSIVVHRYRAVAASGVPAALPRWWLNERDPLVYVTFGTVFTEQAAGSAVLRTVVDALADLPIRLLVTLGGHEDGGTWSGLRPNVHVERWVSEREVLREAAAIVFHGGLGTLLGTLAAGVPSVIVPQFADQPINAARVEAIGAGVRVGMGGTATVDAESVRAAVLRVLSEPRFRLRARRVAEEMAALPPADDAVELITGTARVS